MLAQDFLVGGRAVLVAAIGMANAALRRPSQRNRHVHSPNGQISFHPVADGPTYRAASMQIQNYGQTRPAFAGPHIADLARPFLIGSIHVEAPVLKVRRDTEAVIAFRRRLELLVPLHLNTIFGRQPADAAMPHAKA